MKNELYCRELCRAAKGRNIFLRNQMTPGKNQRPKMITVEEDSLILWNYSNRGYFAPTVLVPLTCNGLPHVEPVRPHITCPVTPIVALTGEGGAWNDEGPFTPHNLQGPANKWWVHGWVKVDKDEWWEKCLMQHGEMQEVSFMDKGTELEHLGVCCILCVLMSNLILHGSWLP